MIFIPDTPVKLQAEVSGMKILKDGGIGISCDKKDVINMPDSIQKQLGRDCEIKISKFPKIILNIDEKVRC